MCGPRYSLARSQIFERLAASLACRTLAILPLQLRAFTIDALAEDASGLGRQVARQIFFKQTVSFLIENGIDRIERGFDFRRTAP
jgi:hypothetical protein